VSSRRRTARFETKPPDAHLSGGYERWRCYEDGRDAYVYVHRLLAVTACVDADEWAEQGLDALGGRHVHHVRSIPWLNTPENLELVDPEPHAEIHLRASASGGR